MKEESDQINSSSNLKNDEGNEIYDKIKSGIDMILDSDEDEYEREMKNYYLQQNDGMIEKDLDNWI